MICPPTRSSVKLGVGNSNFETITPSSANTLAWACPIGPNALVDPMRAVRLAEKAVAADPDAYYCLSTLATALHARPA